MSKIKILIGLSLLAVIVFFVFVPNVNNEFLKCWDDHIYIVDNALIHELTWTNIKAIFSNFTLGNYHPLTLLFYSVEYLFFQTSPAGYHLVSIILHMINCLLVCWLIYKLSRNGLVSLLAGLLFAIHPLRVESVAWIADQKDLLCALFFFAAIIFYLIFQEKKSYRYYLFSLGAFVLSVLAKSSVIILTPLLFLIDWFRGRAFDRDALFEKIPYLIMSLIFGIIAIIARQSYEYQLHEISFTLLETIFINIHRLVFYYLARIFAPVNLALLKPYISGSIKIPVPAIIILISIISVVLFSLKYTKKIFFGSAFFLITLAPVLFVVVLGYSADRFTYISSIGVLYILAEGFTWLYNKKPRYQRLTRFGLSLALIIVVFLCALFSVRLGSVWQDCVSLTDYFVRAYPGDPTVYVNRGLVFEDKNEYNSALADYDKALNLNSNYIQARIKRANIYVLKKKLKSALIDYNYVLELDSLNAEAYYRRANVRYLEENYRAAFDDYNKALGIDSMHAEIYFNRGNVYGRINDHNNAVMDFTKALEIDTLYTKAYYNRGVAYTYLDDFQRAVEDFTRVLEIDSTYIQAMHNRAIALFYMGRYEEAWLDVRRLEQKGYKVHPEFLEALRKASDQ